MDFSGVKVEILGVFMRIVAATLQRRRIKSTSGEKRIDDNFGRTLTDATQIERTLLLRGSSNGTTISFDRIGVGP
jgi:hypothetical protein